MTAKILVADESPTIQKIVTLAFESEDIEVKGVSDGKDAWGMLAEFAPDIVMADVNMAGLSGFELSRKIKSSAEHQERKVILLSSDFEEFDQEGFKACAAEDHLSKPFKSDEIVAKVKHLLSGEVEPNKLEVVDDAQDEPAESTPAEKPAEEAPPTFDLSADDLIDELLEGTEPAPTAETEAAPSETETVVELGADDMVIADMMEEDAKDKKEPVEPVETAKPKPVAVEEKAGEAEPVESAEAQASETEAPEKSDAFLLTDDQMQDFDESEVESFTAPASDEDVLEETFQETHQDEPQNMMDESSPEFYLGEPRQDPEPMEDLDEVFRSVKQSNKKPEPETVPAEPPSENDESTPDLIRETQAFLSGETNGEQTQTESEEKPQPVSPTASSPRVVLDEVVSNHAVRVLQAGLDHNLKQELSGLQDQVHQVVREVIQEMAPDIIRSVIREEIERIRKMEEV